MSAEPPLLRAAGGGIEVLFVGRSPAGGGRVAAAGPDALGRAATLRRAGGGERPVAWLRQRHSAVCRQARPGLGGEGDALWTARAGLALCVATADCVPVALAGGRGIALAHAGWRGIVAGVVPAALAALAAPRRRQRAAQWRAWIGPAIGPCCYEVEEEVAARVERASVPGLTTPGPRGRPHLDLVAAVVAQLRAAGVERVERLGPCTRCSSPGWCSYRRDGATTGRNLAFAWIRPPANATAGG